MIQTKVLFKIFLNFKFKCDVDSGYKDLFHMCAHKNNIKLAMHFKNVFL